MLLTLLPTKLYFRERSHLADYVSDSQVYNLLNQAYTKVRQKPHKIADYHFKNKRYESHRSLF